MSLVNTLFPEYRRRVLGLLLLHPEQKYHLRELARATNSAPGTLARELAKLESAGILSKKKVGNQLQYAANTDCPIFAELASILRKTSGLTDVLAEALLPLADRISHAFVFGSMASGRETAHSDIDLIVVGNVRFTDVLTHLYPAQEVLRREINPKVFNNQEWLDFKKSESSFAAEVLSKPKLFVFGNLSNLN